MVRTTMAMLVVSVGLSGCAPDAPPRTSAPAAVTPAAPAAAVAPAAGEPAAAGEPGTPALGVGASVGQTVAELRELKTSAFELALFRLEMLDAPRLKETLLERQIGRAHV
jgi:hypothetical protein